MHTIGLTVQQVQVNTKFLNALLSEWSKFFTDVKLAKSLYTTNFDQSYAYFSRHERHANEVRISRERYLDPLAFIANSPTLYNPSQSPQHSGNRGIATTSKGNFATGQPGVVKCYNCQGEGHMARQSEAQEAGQILDEEQLTFLDDCRYPGRRPREGNDERVDDLNGHGNDQGLGANGGVEGVNGNIEGANGGAPDFSTIIAQQLQNLLPAMLAQVGNQGNVGNQNGNVVNENVQENVRNVLVNGNRVGCSYKEFLA
ncbi:reverse transcriptase domain-containing protein [Tanacetum coccineum]